jgi:3-phosphoshikimate 1-carboxyvinyltransferase
MYTKIYTRITREYAHSYTHEYTHYTNTHTHEYTHIQIPPNQTYKTSGEAFVEGDASSASYFLAGATITGGTVVVEGCGSASVQGDVRFAEVGG